MMTILNGELFKKRVERKYFITKNESEDLLQMLVEKLGISLRPEIFDDETNVTFIKNIYFDSWELSAYHESIQSSKLRSKIRIRSYINKMGVEQSFLEIKKKANGVTHKERVLLKTEWVKDILLYKKLPIESIVDLNRQIISSKEIFVFLETVTDYFDNKHYFPVLETSYTRLSYKGRDPSGQKMRVTVDKNLKFKRLEKTSAPKITYDKTFLKNGIIVEVKTKNEADEDFFKSLSNLIGKNQKFSKYCYGIFLTNKDHENISAMQA
jgi:SPX domain protein involved in polyphosphate accumulation